MAFPMKLTQLGYNDNSFLNRDSKELTNRVQSFGSITPDASGGTKSTKKCARKLSAMTFIKLSVITIFATILAMAFSNTPYASTKAPNSRNIDQEIPSVFLSENIATNINKYNQTIIDKEDTPEYLIFLLSYFYDLFSEFVHVHKPFETSFIYGYGDGYNDTDDGPCFNETVTPLREQYAWNQRFLISLLNPNDPNQHPIEPAQNVNDSEPLLDEIDGGYGGGFQVYCDGRMLVTSGGGASFVDKKYPSFLDIEDLIEMNLLNLYDDDQYVGFLIFECECFEH